MNDAEERISCALTIAMNLGGVEGEHHKAYVIDQMVRALTGCKYGEQPFMDCNGKPYVANVLNESDEYQQFIKEHNDGEDGPDSYEWDVGIPP